MTLPANTSGNGQIGPVDPLRAAFSLREHLEYFLLCFQLLKPPEARNGDGWQVNV
jgi:hypothetical protein